MHSHCLPRLGAGWRDGTGPGPAGGRQGHQADADQYAPDLIGLARQGLEQAQRAAGDRRERKNAPAMALRAAADADLARVRSEEATVTAQLQLRRNEVNQLQRQLSTGEDRR